MKKRNIISLFVPLAMILTSCGGTDATYHIVIDGLSNPENNTNINSESSGNIESRSSDDIPPSSVPSQTPSSDAPYSNPPSGSSIPSPSSSTTPSSSSSEIIVKPLVISDFQNAINYSNPSQINTNQSFELDQNDIVLHFSSSLIIQYASPVRTCYTYSYEKLNQIVTGNESFISTVSKTLYSEGASAYDGVNWVYGAEEATTLTGAKLDKNYAEMAIDENTLYGMVYSGKEKNFFGADYGVSDVSFNLTLEEGKLKNLVLSFKTNLDFIGDSATINSVTTFSYNPQTVIIPK